MAKQFAIRQHGWHWYVYGADECLSEGYASREDAEAEAEARQCEADQQADCEATWEAIDLIYGAVQGMYDADKPATDPRNFAVREVLDAIETMQRPEQKEAA